MIHTVYSNSSSISIVKSGRITSRSAVQPSRVILFSKRLIFLKVWLFLIASAKERAPLRVMLFAESLRVCKVEEDRTKWAKEEAPLSEISFPDKFWWDYRLNEGDWAALWTLSNTDRWRQLRLNESPTLKLLNSLRCFLRRRVLRSEHSATCLQMVVSLVLISEEANMKGACCSKTS